MKKKKEQNKFGCYGNDVLFNESTCSNDNCKWLIPCKILCGNKLDVYEYVLVNSLNGILERKEIIQILMLNYGISYNASKLAIQRWKKIQ